MSELEERKIPKLDELITKEDTTKINDIDKITDKIYISGEEGALEFEKFLKENINTVLSITDSPPKYSEELNINHKIMNFEDCLSQNIIPYIKECIEFIENSNKILIHCSCGISRSPTIVIAYLIWKTHSSFNQVLNFVQSRRSSIEPSIGFIKQLKNFEKIIKKNGYDIQNIDSKSINVK